MKVIEKLLSLFLVIMGISIISVWTLLIITDNVPDIKKDLISLSFHWTSELLLALISIIIAFAILFNKKWGQSSVFFTLGLALSSTFNAVFYYIFNEFNIAFIIIIGSFFILSLFFLIFSLIRFNFQDIKNSFIYKFGLFNLGLLLYLVLNIAGEFCQAKRWSAFISFIFLILMDIYYSLTLINFKGEKK